MYNLLIIDDHLLLNIIKYKLINKIVDVKIAKIFISMTLNIIILYYYL